MPSSPSTAHRSALCLLAACLAGCASPTAPLESGASSTPHSNPAVEQAIEAARRDERQKIMQEYWYDHTAAAGDSGESAGPEGPPVLLYPAGNYDGINFALRQAHDPSLAEPIR
jgi:hypothetical protein